jgi:hypothetical protein
MPCDNHNPPDGFRVIPGYPRYAIDENGDVLSTCLRGSRKSRPWTKAMRLAFSVDKDGYHRVSLSHDGHSRQIPVHTLVLLTFVGPCPDGMQCRHLDGNPANNQVTNLAWGTRLENAQDTRLHGTAIVGENSPNTKLRNADVLEIRKRRANGYSLDEIAFDFGVSINTVSTIAHRKSWKHI